MSEAVLTSTLNLCFRKNIRKIKKRICIPWTPQFNILFSLFSRAFYPNAVFQDQISGKRFWSNSFFKTSRAVDAIFQMTKCHMSLRTTVLSGE